MKTNNAKPNFDDTVRGFLVGLAGGHTVFYGISQAANSLGAGDGLSLAFGIAGGLISGGWMLETHCHGAAAMRNRTNEPS